MEHDIFIRIPDVILKENLINISIVNATNQTISYVGRVEWKSKDVITEKTANILEKILKIADWIPEWEDMEGYKHNGDETNKAWEIIQNNEFNIYYKMDRLCGISGPLRLKEGHGLKEIYKILEEGTK